jgi:hypothetical protein
MPDQHKLTREEHRAAVVKFTQELTDTQPANAGSDCGSIHPHRAPRLR